MSHIARCKIQLKNVNRELLKQVINFLAAKHRGSTVTAVQDFYGTKTNVNIGFKTQEFQRGIGIIFNKDGTVEFVFDDFNCEQAVQRLKDEITQTYTAEAVVTALNAMGYTVQTSEFNKHIILNGVKE